MLYRKINQEDGRFVEFEYGVDREPENLTPPCHSLPQAF